jgi:hypothetical protein
MQANWMLEIVYIYMEGAHVATFKKTQRQERTRTVQDDDRIFHPAKLVRTYSKKQELRRCKTRRPIKMTSMHTPCRLINQSGSCKIHDKCKPWCANKENYITRRATEPSKYHQLIKLLLGHGSWVVLGCFHCLDESQIALALSQSYSTRIRAKELKRYLSSPIPSLFRLG